ncbi:MAG: hypothetical protein AAGI90_06375 [Chlamydiota bacterium]
MSITTEGKSSITVHDLATTQSTLGNYLRLSVFGNKQAETTPTRKRVRIVAWAWSYLSSTLGKLGYLMLSIHFAKRSVSDETEATTYGAFLCWCNFFGFWCFSILGEKMIINTISGDLTQEQEDLLPDQLSRFRLTIYLIVSVAIGLLNVFPLAVIAGDANKELLLPTWVAPTSIVLFESVICTYATWRLLVFLSRTGSLDHRDRQVRLMGQALQGIIEKKRLECIGYLPDNPSGSSHSERPTRNGSEQKDPVLPQRKIDQASLREPFLVGSSENSTPLETALDQIQNIHEINHAQEKVERAIGFYFTRTSATSSSTSRIHSIANKVYLYVFYVPGLLCGLANMWMLTSILNRSAKSFASKIPALTQGSFAIGLGFAVLYVLPALFKDLVVIPGGIAELVKIFILLLTSTVPPTIEGKLLPVTAKVAYFTGTVFALGAYGPSASIPQYYFQGDERTFLSITLPPAATGLVYNSIMHVMQQALRLLVQYFDNNENHHEMIQFSDRTERLQKTIAFAKCPKLAEFLLELPQNHLRTVIKNTQPDRTEILLQCSEKIRSFFFSSCYPQKSSASITRKWLEDYVQDQKSSKAHEGLPHPGAPLHIEKV